MRIIFPIGALFSLFAIFTCTILPSAIATAATTTVQDILIPGGNYYVGDVFGKQDYHGHANAAVASYRIMKTEVTYALYSSVSDWGALRWTPDMRQVAMRESCFYKRPRNRSSHEAVTAEAQRDV